MPIFPNLSALRSLRVLRPLKSVSKLPGLRKIIVALTDSADDLCNVIFLLTFLIVCFSVMGILFWNGLLHARCRLTPFPVKMPEGCNSIDSPCWEVFVKKAIKQPKDYRCLPDANDDPSWTQSTSPWFLKGPQNCIWPIDNNDERVCSLSGFGFHSCSPLHTSSIVNGTLDRTCGSNYDRFGNNRFVNNDEPYGFERMNSGTFLEGLNWGFTNFDSFLSAFITTFQVITLEGWTNVMNQVVDAWYFAPTVFIFSLEVILCGYIVMNLVLAVITSSLDQMDDEDDDDDFVNNVSINEGLINDKESCGSNKFRKFMEGKYHSTFIMVCIVLNTIVLSLDHYGISEEVAELLENLNIIFTVVFLVDVILGNFAFGPRIYWRLVCHEYINSLFELIKFFSQFTLCLAVLHSDSLMCFDGVIGIISLVELVITYAFPNVNAGSNSFSVFRSLRLFRVFKMAKNWKSLHSLLQTMIESVKEIGNFAILLFLFVFIYSLVGMQLLSNRLHFSPDSGVAVGIREEGYESALIPRSHFDSFFWSIVTVFQILSGENWNVVMYDGWRAKGAIAVIYIISLIVVGVFIVMNLFLAILLKKFDESEESALVVDESKIDKHIQLKEEQTTEKGNRPSMIQILWARLSKNNIARKLCFRIVESSLFEVGVTILIVGSSLCLVLDSPLLDPDSTQAQYLQYCDFIFTSLFIAEMIVKILAYGFILEKGAYLRNSWNMLDFVTVLVSILNLLDIGPGSSLRALRTFRVLRPLRILNRLPGLRVVVDALLLSFPSVGDVAVMCTLFFLIFSSFGVNFLKGTFYHCEGEIFGSLSKEKIDYLIYPHAWGKLSDNQQSWFDVGVEGCEASSWTTATIPTSKNVCDCLAPGGWKPIIPQSFDNVMSGMALLFEIATTEGWIDVMYAAVDQRGIEMQPVRDNNPLWALFFIVFLIVGAFFVLELFVGVVIQNFNKIKERTGKAMMTDAQKQWAATQSFVMKIKPERRLARPAGAIGGWCYDFVMPSTNPRFQDFITMCILISSALSASVTFGDSDKKTRLLENCNLIFSIIFTIELILKLFGFGKRYFDDGWNRFDFIVVCSSNAFSIIGFFVSQTGPISSVIRLVRVCRLFKLIKRVKNLRLLFNTLIVSIPSIINIGTLLLLLFFIYAVIGMQLFSFIPNNDEVTSQSNFRSFGSAMFLLLRFSTGENWNGYMRSILTNKSDCVMFPKYNPDAPWCLSNEDYPICTEINGCGAGFSAFIYFYSFTLLISFVIMNLFVGIVLEAFENGNEGDILSPDDMNHFTQCWAEFDPKATWHIKATDMKRLLIRLGSPLGVESRDLRVVDRVMKDDCLKELPVNGKGEVNIVHVATHLAKRLTKMKQGNEFQELTDDHPIQMRIASTRKEGQQTLNEVYKEKSKMKLRVLRAFVKAKIKPENIM